MTEITNFIPARLKNAAVGGHVAGAEDIIDENTGETLDQLSVKPATTGTTGDYPYNGLGRVILRKNMVSGVNTLTQDMFYKGEVGSRVPNTNTVFVVKYDFVLGEDITVPANCVLEFDGGSISGNNTLTFADTDIIGIPKILCNVAGTLPKADITWFGAIDGDNTIDSGAIINKVASVTGHIIIPEGTFYIINTMVSINIGILDWYGLVVYIGTTINTEVFTVSGMGCINMYGALVCQSPNISYTGELGSNIKGLVLINFHDSVATIKHVAYFNVNLTIIGDGYAAADNLIYLSFIRHANIGILITQNNGGYSNQNTFIGGRITNESRWDPSTCESHAIVVKKIYNDDSYNKCNGLLFDHQNIEGYGQMIPIVLSNCQSSSFLYYRAEDVVTPVKLIGNCTDLTIKAEFGSENIDFSEISHTPTGEVIKSDHNYTSVLLDYKNPLIGTIGNDSYTPLALWRGYYDGETEVAATYSSSDALLGRIGFKIIFFNAIPNIFRLTTVGNSGIRRHYYVRPYKGFAGNIIPQDDTRADYVYGIYGLTFRSNYHIYREGYDRSSVYAICKETLKEVVCSFDNIKAVIVELLTPGYIVAGLSD